MLVTERSSRKRSQKLFVAQWKHTGALNAQIEEAFTGHALVKVFGRQREVRGDLRGQERGAVRGRLRRPVHLRHRSMPAMMFIGNLNYVAIAVVGGLRVASGHDDARRRAGVHPVLPAVHPAAHPAGVDGQPAAVRRRLGRAGLRAARRRGAGSRTPARGAVDRTAAGGSSSSTSRSRYDPDKPLITDLSLVAEPGQTVAIVGPDRRGQDHAGQPDHAVLRARRRPHHARRRRHRRRAPGTTCAASIGMVLQDTWLFGGTIRDNIAYGNRTPPRTRSSRRPRRPTSTASCTRCPTATTR